MTARNNERSRPHGRTVRCPGGYSAYVPAPLPPGIAWDGELVLALSHADHAMGRLAGEGRLMPVAYLLIRAFLYKEAVLSSRIEGTQVSLGELLAAHAGAKVERSAEELHEVAKLHRRVRLRHRSFGKPSAFVAPGSRTARAADARRAGRQGHARRVSPQPELDRSFRMCVERSHLCSTPTG